MAVAPMGQKQRLACMVVVTSAWQKQRLAATVVVAKLEEGVMGDGRAW